MRLETVIDVLQEAYEGPGAFRSYPDNTGNNNALNK
jgi:hypothetical protein